MKKLCELGSGTRKESIPTCCHGHSPAMASSHHQIMRNSIGSSKIDRCCEPERRLRQHCCCATPRQELQVTDAGPASTSTAPSNGHHTNGHGPRGFLESEDRPTEVDYSRLWSREGRKRLMPGLRDLSTKFNGIKGLIPLHGGLPPASAFPLKGLQLTLKDGTQVDITGQDELVAAQQYNLSLKGYAPLLKWIVEHMRQLHGPQSDHEIIILGGSTYTLEIIMRLFMDPGDAMLCEEYTYPHVPESLVWTVDYRSIGVPVDEHGIIPEQLHTILQGLQSAGHKVPKLLYTVPVGQNPTGATQTQERKRQIYSICSEFNILIVEDDPYYYLQYTPGEGPRGLLGLGASYLSMDTECRVLRLDSFSKILAPGVRVSWLTAHPAVTTKVLYHSHGVAMGPCSLSQVILASMLAKMGQGGFGQHVRGIQEQYSRRAGIMAAAAERHLQGLAEWAVPEAGMFMWLRLLDCSHTSRLLDSMEAAGVIFVPGNFASHEGSDTKTPCPFVRLSFVTAEEGELEPAMQRLAGLLQELQSE